MENQKFNRKDMASYLLDWCSNSDERYVQAQEMAGWTDSEIEKAFWEEYTAQQGMTPPKEPDFGIDLQHIPGIE